VSLIDESVGKRKKRCGRNWHENIIAPTWTNNCPAVLFLAKLLWTTVNHAFSDQLATSLLPHSPFISLGFFVFLAAR
jgi:hypothetical protein